MTYVEIFGNVSSRASKMIWRWLYIRLHNNKLLSEPFTRLKHVGV